MTITDEDRAKALSIANQAEVVGANKTYERIMALVLTVEATARAEGERAGYARGIEDAAQIADAQTVDSGSEWSACADYTQGAILALLPKDPQP